MKKIISQTVECLYNKAEYLDVCVSNLMSQFRSADPSRQACILKDIVTLVKESKEFIPLGDKKRFLDVIVAGVKSDSYESQFVALRWIVQVSADPESRRQMIVHGGIVDALFSGIKSDKLKLGRGELLTCLLGFYSQSVFAPQIVRYVDELVAESRSEDAGARDTARRCLLNLSLLSSCRATLFRHGPLFDVLLAGMKSDDVEIQHASIGCLNNLFIDSGSAFDMDRHKELVDTVIAELKSPCKEVRIASIKCLCGMIFRDKSNTHLAQYDGVLASIVWVAQQDDFDGQFPAIQCLSRLSTNAENLGMLARQDGVLGILVAAAQSSELKVKSTALVCLSNLACDESVAELLVAYPNLFDTVVTLSQLDASCAHDRARPIGYLAINCVVNLFVSGAPLKDNLAALETLSRGASVQGDAQAESLCASIKQESRAVISKLFRRRFSRFSAQRRFQRAISKLQKYNAPPPLPVQDESESSHLLPSPRGSRNVNSSQARGYGALVVSNPLFSR